MGASSRCSDRKAEPIGAFVNDNVMVTTTAICAPTHDEAVRIAVNGGLHYLPSLVFRYHDTFPRPDGFPVWPETLPEYNEDYGTLDASASFNFTPDITLFFEAVNLLSEPRIENNNSFRRIGNETFGSRYFAGIRAKF